MVWLQSSNVYNHGSRNHPQSFVLSIPLYILCEQYIWYSLSQNCGYYLSIISHLQIVSWSCIMVSQLQILKTNQCVAFSPSFRYSLTLFIFSFRLYLETLQIYQSTNCPHRISQVQPLHLPSIQSQPIQT